MDTQKSISFILPATDETNALEETVRRIVKLFPNATPQLIIVTHTKLTTLECQTTISKLQQEFGTIIETFDQARPQIGGAIQDSIDRAHGDFTVLMASDLETDPVALPAMLAKMEEGYDIVATTRWKRGAGFKGYDPLKFVLNFFFQHIFRILYWTSLTDLTYAYRVYRTEILKSIRWEEPSFPFLFETIIKPLRLGYKVAEVEAPWVARTEGVSHNSFRQTFDYVRVGLRMRFMSKKRMRT